MTSISSITFNGLGTHLAVAHFNHSLELLKLPFSKFGAASNQIVNSTCKIISSSLVSNTCSKPSKPRFSTCGNFLAFNHQIFYSSISTKCGDLKSVLTLPEVATNTQFLHNDQFVLFSCDGCVSLNHLRFRIDQDQISNSFAIQEPCKSWNLPGNVLALASVNETLSGIIGISLSDRSIRVIDVESGDEQWTAKNKTGSNSAHSLIFPNTVASSHLQPARYNIVASASVSDGGLITLFDLRTSTEICHFTSHVNRKGICSISFSPCMRYIATGNEAEGGAILYDIRKQNSNPLRISTKSLNGRPLLDGPITEVAFNPLRPQLVTGSVEGRMRFYTEDIFSDY